MRARALMVQGTASSVGKSIVVTALCRIFRQDGYRVAPFKAQNMTLNIFVTAGGDEMGRAQAVQAFAAGSEPVVEMNPVLLKPQSDNCTQLIIRGKASGTYDARSYYRHSLSLMPVIRESYSLLAENNDIIVIEGAGSPAEINLRKRETANMRIAEMAQAPVLLVGDIDRGGVFASLAGTMLLLPSHHRKLIRGFIINKFRGDISLLETGLNFLEKRYFLPVLGVIPYFHGINIPQEDSLNSGGQAERLSDSSAFTGRPVSDNYPERGRSNVRQGAIDLEQSYNELSDIIRKSIDMNMIYTIIGGR